AGAGPRARGGAGGGGRVVGSAGPLPVGVAGVDDAAELEPPGPGGAGRAAVRRLGRHLVRGGLLRGPGPSVDREPARRGQAVLRRGLAAGVNGGGGQIGSWTGERPNVAGELLQIGRLPARR